jgi:hypothetical protein
METHAGRIWDKRALEEMNWSNNMKYRPEQAMLALLLGLACRTLQDLTVGAVYHQNKRGSAEAVVGTSYCPTCRATFHNLQRLKIGTVWHETAVERVPTSVAPVFDYLERKHPKLRLLHIWDSMELQPSKTPGEVTLFELMKPRTMQMYQLGLPRSSKSLLLVPFTDRGMPDAPLRGLRLLHRKTLEFSTTSESFPDRCSLKVLELEWDLFEHPDHGDLQSTHSLISTQKDLLESLTLVAETYRYSGGRPLVPPSKPLCSLRDFTCLTLLNISVLFLLGVPLRILVRIGDWTAFWNKNRPFVPIVEIPPPSLQRLELSNIFGVGEDALALHDLARDIHQLPRLKTVHLDWAWGSFDDLINESHATVYRS